MGTSTNGSPGMTGPEDRARPRYRFVRWAINAWLVFHLSAIILAPASVSPSSALIRSGWGACRPYLQALYLNHGYHYFAPEPSQSTLVAYEAELKDGSVVQGRFPDRKIWPRLLYHRHFMLTEQLDTAPPELRERWPASYARHLGETLGARRVSLTRLTHDLPTPAMVRGGVRLDDPRSYAEQPLGTFTCDD